MSDELITDIISVIKGSMDDPELKGNMHVKLCYSISGESVTLIYNRYRLREKYNEEEEEEQH